MSSSPAQQPSPILFFQTINAYQRTEALKAAIELDVFTAIGEGNTTADKIAQRCKASERGTRILCDFLTIMGFLNKDENQLQPDPRLRDFSRQRSPAYLGGTIEFMATEKLTGNFKNFADAVRKGGSTDEEGGTVAPDNPIWVKFARGMAPMIAMPAQIMAKLVDPDGNRKQRILDIAAGHGLFGIAFAKNNPTGRDCSA